MYIILTECSNNIREVEQLSYLTLCSSLRSLTLDGNPVCLQLPKEVCLCIQSPPPQATPPLLPSSHAPTPPHITPTPTQVTPTPHQVMPILLKPHPLLKSCPLLLKSRPLLLKSRPLLLKTHPLLLKTHLCLNC